MTLKVTINPVRRLGYWWSDKFRASGCIGKLILLVVPLICSSCFLATLCIMSVSTPKTPAEVAGQGLVAENTPIPILEIANTVAREVTNTPEATFTLRATFTVQATYTALPTYTPLPTFTPVPQLIILTDGVVLRGGPSAFHDSLDILEADDVVLILGRAVNSSWYNVQLANGIKGWIPASMIAPADGVDLDGIVIAATIPAEPTREPTLPPASPTIPPPTLQPTKTSTPQATPTFIPIVTVVPIAPPAPTSPPPETQNCTSGYSPCIPPGPDVDCAGGSGNGPRYVQGPIIVDHAFGDPYGLDRDGDGVGCE